jgi:hypothetical protein
MRFEFERKGMTIKNFLSLILGVLGILGILLIVVPLFGLFDSNEEENAQAFLDDLILKIKGLEEGEKAKFTVQGFDSDKGWVLTGWGKNVDNRPEKCFFESCLCVCPGGNDLKTSCQDKGFCEEVDKEELRVGNKETIVVSEEFIANSPLKTFNKIDAAVNTGKGYFFFSGNNYYEYLQEEISLRFLKEGLISERWPKVGEGGIDAAFTLKDTNRNNYIYFIKGDKSYRLNEDGTLPRLHELDISQVFVDKKLRNIDAVLNTNDFRTIYVFIGEDYYRLDGPVLSVGEDYPAKISLEWVGIPNNLNAATLYSNRLRTIGRLAYFFKDNEYYVFDFDKDSQNSRLKSVNIKKLLHDVNVRKEVNLLEVVFE